MFYLQTFSVSQNIIILLPRGINIIYYICFIITPFLHFICNIHVLQMSSQSRSCLGIALTIILHLILCNLHMSRNFLEISLRNMNNLLSNNIHYTNYCFMVDGQLDVYNIYINKCLCVCVCKCISVLLHLLFYKKD